MAYKLEPITRDRVFALLKVASAAPGAVGLKQPEMLDALRGPLEYRESDGVDEAGNLFAKGDVIPRPHADLEVVLAEMKVARLAYFSKEHRGWRLH
jgi:hypothetical protein